MSRKPRRAKEKDIPFLGEVLAAAAAFFFSCIALILFLIAKRVSVNFFPFPPLPLLRDCRAFACFALDSLRSAADSFCFRSNSWTLKPSIPREALFCFGGGGKVLRSVCLERREACA